MLASDTLYIRIVNQSSLSEFHAVHTKISMTEQAKGLTMKERKLMRLK